MIFEIIFFQFLVFHVRVILKLEIFLRLLIFIIIWLISLNLIKFFQSFFGKLNFRMLILFNFSQYFFILILRIIIKYFWGFLENVEIKNNIAFTLNKIDSLISSHDKENAEHRTQVLELQSEIGKLKNEISAFQFKINTSKSTLENYQVQLKMEIKRFLKVQENILIHFNF